MNPAISNESIAAQDRPIQHANTGTLRSRLTEQLDEIAVFAFVAVAVIYIAAATYGLFW